MYYCTFVNKICAIYYYYRSIGFAENLKNELEYQDIQIKELSQKTGISKNTLDKYLSARKSQPGVENAVRIAKVLGVSVESLVTGNKDSTKSLSFEYEQMLKKYQALSPFNKKTVLDLLEAISSREEKVF